MGSGGRIRPSLTNVPAPGAFVAGRGPAFGGPKGPLPGLGHETGSPVAAENVPKFNEFFSGQPLTLPVEQPKRQVSRDKRGDWPFKDFLKKTLSANRFFTIAYPKPNQTHGETNDQKRA